MKRSGKTILLLVAAALLLALPVLAAAGHYTVNDGVVKNGPHDVEIIPNTDLVANGEEQELLKSAKVQDGIIWYRVSRENLWKQLPLTQSEEWTTEAPVGKDAGDYYVLVYIESTIHGEGYRDSGSQILPMACFRVTIAAK